MSGYYWSDIHKLGAGPDAIKRGDELPEKYEKDPRLKRWLKAGNVTTEKIVTFDEEKNYELDKAKERIAELEATLEGSGQENGQNKAQAGKLQAANKRVKDLKAEVTALEEKVEVMEKQIEDLTTPVEEEDKEPQDD